MSVELTTEMITQLPIDRQNELGMLSHTLSQDYSPDVVDNVIKMGIVDQNLTHAQLRTLASKELSQKQIGLNEDFTRARDGINKGDTAFSAQSYADRYLHPDSTYNYSKAELKFAEDKYKALGKLEDDKLAAQVKLDTEAGKLAEEDSKLILEQIANAEEFRQFESAMNIEVFDELNRAIMGAREVDVAGTPIKEFDEDVQDAVGAIGVKKNEEERLLKYEELQKIKNEYIQQLGDRVGDSDVGSVEAKNEALLQNEASFLRVLDELVVAINPIPEFKVTYHKGRPVYSDQKQSQAEANAELYNRIKTKYLQNLEGIKIKFKENIGGSETPEEVDPYLQYLEN